MESSGIFPVKFFLGFKHFYFGLNFRNRSYMEEAFGISVGQYYAGYYYGDGWCAGKLNEHDCLE